MGLSHRLELRQGQSLVMTPQLLQAIKLLQLSHLELVAYVEAELERNPLLERAEEGGDAAGPDALAGDGAHSDGGGDGADGLDADGFSETAAEGGFRGEAVGEAPGLDRDFAGDAFTRDAEAGDRGLDTGFDNVFPDDAPMRGTLADAGDPGGSVWSGTGAGGSFEDEEGFDLEARLTAETSLHDHLLAQLDIAVADPVDRLIGRHLIDAVDEAGYLGESLEAVAARLDAPETRVAAVLALVQTFEPSGVAARNLAECLSIQLRERDRLDPAMAALVARLDLVARRDLAGLRKLTGLEDEDILDMLAEIRELEPKPGRAFGAAPVQVLVPDVLVRPAADGSWHIELNAQTLPRVLVNQAYYARVARHAVKSEDKSFLAECLQNANWLTRSLEQRARTILKVAAEIVRQQDAFFAYGVEHLRPLNLKTIADAIGMHESTVSRVTANKSIGTSRGVFEMKYFFSAAISATGGGDAHSAEAVRHRIKQMIDAEEAEDVLSDDTIVKRLRDTGIDIARRTVAKYRESLKIPSSVERRRLKLASGR